MAMDKPRTYRIEHRQFDGPWWTGSDNHGLGEAWERADPYAGLTAEEVRRTTLLIQTRVVDENSGTVVMGWGVGEDNREEARETYEFLNRVLTPDPVG